MNADLKQRIIENAQSLHVAVLELKKNVDEFESYDDDCDFSEEWPFDFDINQLDDAVSKWIKSLEKI